MAMHRQFADELAAFVVDAPPFTVGDVVNYRFKRTGAVAGAAYERVPDTVLIDEDVTWREDGVRRLLADPSATDLIFTDAGVMQVTDLDIDLEPELKELIPPAEAKWIDEEIERLGSALLSLAYARGLQILNGE